MVLRIHEHRLGLEILLSFPNLLDHGSFFPLRSGDRTGILMDHILRNWVETETSNKQTGLGFIQTKQPMGWFSPIPE